MSVTWVQIGTDTGTYATPDQYPQDPNWARAVLSTTFGTMPTELAITGGVLPDFKVTYHLLNGQTTEAFYIHPSQLGFGGLSLYGDGSNTSLGLFTGIDAIGGQGGPVKVDPYANYLTTPPSTAAFGPIPDNGGNTPANLTPYDVTVTVVGGVVTVTATSPQTGMEGLAARSFSYTPTAGQIASWAGKTKYGAFRGMVDGSSSYYHYAT